jgi:hypothetical protein
LLLERPAAFAQPLHRGRNGRELRPPGAIQIGWRPGKPRRPVRRSFGHNPPSHPAFSVFRRTSHAATDSFWRRPCTPCAWGGGTGRPLRISDVNSRSSRDCCRKRGCGL